MGGHNRSRPCPSLGWMGVDGEQIVWKNGSCDAQSGAGSLCRNPVGELQSPSSDGLTLVMSCAGPGDSIFQSGNESERRSANLSLCSLC